MLAADLMAAVGDIAREAGERIMTIYCLGRTEPRFKDDASPVTAADLDAHQFIVAQLAKLTPNIPTISEESTDVVTQLNQFRTQGCAFWLVDPLDGTRDFLARTGDFTVNIALVDEAIPQFGCIYAPVRDELFIAGLGQGAYFVKAGQSQCQIGTRRLREGSFLKVLVSRHHSASEAQDLRAAFPEACIEAVGSSLKYCLIAKGEADAAIRRTPTRIWDTAAAECILTEAGGLICGPQEQPLAYDGRNISNPPFLALGDKTTALKPWLDLIR